MHVELRQLRYFVAVAEEKHFGRAAIRLNMTQPPLSQTIFALEALLGEPLFIRTKRHVSLTPAGQALLPEAQRLLLQTEALPALVKRAANGGSGQLSLSFISTADYSILPPLLTQFRQHYPQVHIALREATTDIQLDDLLERKIDGGLLLPPLTEKTKHLLDYMPLLTEPLIAAVPSGFWKKKQAIPLQTLVRLPLVIFPRHISPSFHDTILSCFHEAGLTPIIAQEAIQMQTIVGLVSAGMGMALVPQSVSNLKRPGVDYLPLASIAPSIETGIAWRRDNHSPVLRAFLTLAAQSTSTGMTLA